MRQRGSSVPDAVPPGGLRAFFGEDAEVAAGVDAVAGRGAGGEVGDAPDVVFDGVVGGAATFVGTLYGLGDVVEAGAHDGADFVLAFVYFYAHVVNGVYSVGFHIQLL